MENLLMEKRAWKVTTRKTFFLYFFLFFFFSRCQFNTKPKRKEPDAILFSIRETGTFYIPSCWVKITEFWFFLILNESFFLFFEGIKRNPWSAKNTRNTRHFVSIAYLRRCLHNYSGVFYRQGNEIRWRIYKGSINTGWKMLKSICYYWLFY